MEEKVSLDMAEMEFERWAEGMDLDIDQSLMDEEDRNTFQKQKRRIINAIKRGSLIINDNDEAVYTPQRTPDAKPLTFHERTGASLLATDTRKKDHNAAKTYAMMGDMCKVNQKIFADMKGIDIKTCEAIFALLMD